MKWIGQHIWDFISRFRSTVYLEDIDTSTETDMLVVDSDGKVTKRAIDAITVDVSDFMTNGTDNYVLTATGTDAINAEATLTFDGWALSQTPDISEHDTGSFYSNYINFDDDKAATHNVQGYYFDYDSSTNSTGTTSIYGFLSNINDAASDNSAGVVTIWGLKNDLSFANANGTTTQYGIKNTLNWYVWG